MPPLRLSPHAIRNTLLNRKFAYLSLWRNIAHNVYGYTINQSIKQIFYGHPQKWGRPVKAYETLQQVYTTTDTEIEIIISVKNRE